VRAGGRRPPCGRHPVVTARGTWGPRFPHRGKSQQDSAEGRSRGEHLPRPQYLWTQLREGVRARAGGALDV